MGSLRDKLQRLDPHSPSNRISNDEPEVAFTWKEQLAQKLGVDVLEEDNAFIFIKEQLWPVYNDSAFSYLQENGFVSHALHSLLGFKEKQPIALRQAIFFDLETTGLAGGTGTFAFLVGVGTVEADAIRVRQFLLPDFNFEWLLLKHVQLLFNNYPLTVSFNGKTFDIPLLANRFTLNRMENILDDRIHLDVLHASRRIWRHVLPTCDLQTLEKHVLGHERVDDFPGSLIPHAYFEFIKNRQVWMIREVLEHNFQDIVNMVLLTTRLAAAAEHPCKYLTTVEEQLALADYYYKTRQDDAALPILTRLIDGEDALKPQHIPRVFFQLAMIFKRKGEPEKAIQYLWQLVERNHFHPRVIEELAKFYEHQEKNYALALELVNRALERLSVLQQLTGSTGTEKVVAALQHRRNRLRRRLEKATGRNS